MTTEDDSDKIEPTFTRAQMARMVNAQVKEKLAAALEPYGDLDDLRKQAEAGKANESKLDALITKMDAAEKRAAAAELSNARRAVADELGLTAKEAKRLTGATVAELKLSGEELIEDFGIDVKSRKAGTTNTKTKETEGGATTGDEDESDATGDAVEQDAEAETAAPARKRAARPTETLRPGAARTQTAPEETDPLKLAALIPRR